jgi:hypothetical protein
MHLLLEHVQKSIPKSAKIECHEGENVHINQHPEGTSSYYTAISTEIANLEIAVP